MKEQIIALCEKFMEHTVQSVKNELREVILQQSAHTRMLKRQEKRITFLEEQIASYRQGASDLEEEKTERKLKITGEQIIAIRERLALTQADFARLLGVDRSCLNRWERGKVTPLQAAIIEIVKFRRMRKKELVKRLDKVEGDIWNS